MYLPEVKSDKENHSNKNSSKINDQDSQGILNQTKIDQDSQGILTESKPIHIFKKEYKLIKLEDITSFTGILDYIDPKPSAFPAIVKTPTKHFCIDGQCLIQKAKKEKESFILCHVIHIDTESELEIAIQKATIRTVSDEGKPYYAELIRNCKDLMDMFLNTIENPVFYSHGGKRSEIEYNENNREENIRILLAERFEKSISTTNKYINYGAYLNNDILESLVQEQTGKKFFEAVASNKRRLIKNLKDDGKSENAIHQKIAEFMVYWHTEWLQSDKEKIEPMSFEPLAAPTINNSLVSAPSEFEHQTEIEDEDDEQSEESIREDLQSFGLAIFTDLNDEEYGTDESIEQLKYNFSQILILTNKLRTVKEVA